MEPGNAMKMNDLGEIKERMEGSALPITDKKNLDLPYHIRRKNGISTKSLNIAITSGHGLIIDIGVGIITHVITPEGIF